jgi:hypothetical protein
MLPINYHGNQMPIQMFMYTGMIFIPMLTKFNIVKQPLSSETIGIATCKTIGRYSESVCVLVHVVCS